MMTLDDKQLLLVDLCVRLPYGVICRFTYTFDGCEVDNVLHPDDITDMFRHRSHCDSRIDVKPYLRLLSSMTEEESAELSNIISEWFDKELFYLTEEPFMEYALQKINYSINPRLFDWLNKKMFDYRGLIPKGHALSTEEFNPYKD